MTSSLLIGLHDREAAPHVPSGGYCVDTVSLSGGVNPTNYTALRGDINWLARLNWGYGSTGTIPKPDGYGDFARRVVSYIQQSPGCTRWIIGNEPNHSQERPDGQGIRPDDYALCFDMVADEVYRQLGTIHQLIPAAVAPWNLESGDWLDYWEQMLEGIGANAGGLALHCYTHGADPAFVTSDEKGGGWHWHLRVYRDLLSVVPATMRHLPVYITESNQGDRGWADTNSGWVQAAYAEIDRHNQQTSTQKIHCLTLYRWPKFDRWHIEGKQGVIDDFRAAVAKGYQSSQTTAQPAASEHKTHLPNVQTESKPVTPNLPPRDFPIELWDRLDLEEYPAKPGESYWRLTKLQRIDEKEHIFASTYSQNGERIPGVMLRRWWGSGNDGEREDKPTMLEDGLGMVDFPMWNRGRAFGLKVANEPSDAVFGMGLGFTADSPNADHHSFVFEFTRVTVPESSTVAPAEPMPSKSQFRVGDTVRVNAPARVRKTPGYLNKPPEDSRVLDPGVVLALIDGPLHTDGLTWWQTADGWIAEVAPGGERLLVSSSGSPLGALPTERPLPTTGIFDPYVLAAIVEVESGDYSFTASGLVIRFENHLFNSATGGRYADLFAVGNPPWEGHAWRKRTTDPFLPTHHGNSFVERQKAEWEVFTFARSLDETAALRSISMGSSQVLGSNAQRIGYASPRAMLDAFSDSAAVQVIGLINYILSDKNLVAAIQARDWNEIAAKYNGSGNVSVYAKLMREAYARLTANL